MGDLEKSPDSEEIKRKQVNLPQWICKELVTEIVLKLFTKYFKHINIPWGICSLNNALK